MCIGGGQGIAAIIERASSVRLPRSRFPSGRWHLRPGRPDDRRPGARIPAGWSPSAARLATTLRDRPQVDRELVAGLVDEALLERRPCLSIEPRVGACGDVARRGRVRRRRTAYSGAEFLARGRIADVFGEQGVKALPGRSFAWPPCASSPWPSDRRSARAVARRCAGSCLPTTGGAAIDGRIDRMASVDLRCRSLVRVLLCRRVQRFTQRAA